MILIIEIFVAVFYLIGCGIWRYLEGGFEPIVAAIGGIIPLLVVMRVSFTTRKIDKDLKFILGEWECFWSFPSLRSYDDFSDKINITELKRGAFKGTGFNHDLGKYEISGEICERIIWLKYNGVDKKKDITGLVLLQRKAQRNILDGEWIQYYSAEKICRGKVSIKKI